MDDYDFVVKKPLNLSNKKSSHKTKKRKLQDEAPSLDPVNPNEEGLDKVDKLVVASATKAEQAFQSRQAKIAEERILKKASKSHRQRVEEFNKHLDSLSEHYDIPKVSWTK